MLSTSIVTHMFMLRPHSCRDTVPGAVVQRFSQHGHINRHDKPCQPVVAGDISCNFCSYGTWAIASHDDFRAGRVRTRVSLLEGQKRGTVKLILSVRPQRLLRDLLNSIHQQEFAIGVVGLRGGPKPRPILLVAKVVQDPFVLCPHGPLLDVGIQVVPRASEDKVRRRFPMRSLFLHPREEQQR